MKSVRLSSPLDMHVHLRQDAMLSAVAPLTAQHFAGAVVMPNLIPPVDSLDRVLTYRKEITSACIGYNFAPYMTLFFREYTFRELEEASQHVIGVKLYPAGATTNSDAGVREIASMHHVFAAMEELDIPLLVHGETHGFVLDREAEFTDTYRFLAKSFPKLRIIMEHITTRKAVELLGEFENLYATVTVHHLLITLNDVVGGLMNPHLFCKPVAKRPEDRDALVDVVTSGHPKVMFGSDSAPHPLNQKECAHCAAGVFTAPIALPLLAMVFAERNALHHLQTFVSSNAKRIYRVAPPETSITLVNSDWTIPVAYGNVIPMWAGKTIPWQVEP